MIYKCKDLWSKAHFISIHLNFVFSLFFYLHHNNVNMLNLFNKINLQSALAKYFAKGKKNKQNWARLCYTIQDKHCKSYRKFT